MTTNAVTICNGQLVCVYYIYVKMCLFIHHLCVTAVSSNLFVYDFDGVCNQYLATAISLYLLLHAYNTPCSCNFVNISSCFWMIPSEVPKMRSGCLCVNVCNVLLYFSQVCVLMPHWLLLYFRQVCVLMPRWLFSQVCVDATLTCCTLGRCAFWCHVDCCCQCSTCRSEFLFPSAGTVNQWRVDHKPKAWPAGTRQPLPPSLTSTAFTPPPPTP